MSYELLLLSAYERRAFAGGAGAEKKKDDGPLVKICRDTSKLATEQVREQIMQSEGMWGIGGRVAEATFGEGVRGTERSWAPAST